MECRLVNQVPFKVDTAYFGEIAEIYAEEHVLTNNDPDPAKINPILFTFPDKGLWRLGERIGEGWSSGKAYRPKKD
jgi:flavin reductase (DIM6/NTAB) family NADH-FMN oxidoreductase RutF